ncbi:MAG: restriction endonuclease subunit S [Planctomycetes bacterium]|nr:restriction endonuclease subunit S [Planctomycetota bacterium]
MSLIRLGDVCCKIGSGATPRGGSDVYRDHGVALIRSQNVHNGGFKEDGLAFIGPEHARELDGVTVQPGDVLLNITGDSVARVCEAPRFVHEARVNQHVAIIRPDPNRVDARFLRYVLVSPRMQAHMLALASAGATRNALTKGMIEDFRVDAPPIAEQLAIASILGALDDKIELNRRMNETLEGITRALFKSWFVDFDPVRAKAAGRQPVGMDAETARLFPERVVESEIGEVPFGWTSCGLDEIATFLNGLALQKFPASAGELSLPVIKIAELRSGVTSKTDRANTAVPDQFVVQDGDVLFSWSGSLEIVIWSNGRGALNQHLFKVTSATHPIWFVHSWIEHHLPEFRAIAADKATTMGHIQRRHLTKAQAVVPSKEVLKRADAIIQPHWRRRVLNSVQMRTLASLRDALLPKLLSGELRVRDAERAVEGVR